MKASGRSYLIAEHFYFDINGLVVTANSLQGVGEDVKIYMIWFEVMRLINLQICCPVFQEESIEIFDDIELTMLHQNIIQT